MTNHTQGADLKDLIQRLNDSLLPSFTVRCRLADSGSVQLTVEETRGEATVALCAQDLEPFSDDVSPTGLSRAFSDLVMTAGLGLSVFRPSIAEKRHLVAAK